MTACLVSLLYRVPSLVGVSSCTTVQCLNLAVIPEPGAEQSEHKARPYYYHYCVAYPRFTPRNVHETGSSRAPFFRPSRIHQYVSKRRYAVLMPMTCSNANIHRQRISRHSQLLLHSRRCLHSSSICRLHCLCQTLLRSIQQRSIPCLRARKVVVPSPHGVDYVVRQVERDGYREHGEGKEEDGVCESIMSARDTPST